MAITIQQFFASYLDAQRRHNADAICGFYVLPCLIADGSGQQVLDDRDAVLRHVQRQLAAHTASGTTSERLTIRSLLLLGDDFAVANVAWSMRDSNRNLRTFHAAYNVRRVNGDWAIWAVTQHETVKE